jgi:hypothetical protein
MSERRFAMVFWRFGVTFTGLGFWVGFPRYVTDGRGFQRAWRPFGLWATSSPFAWRSSVGEGEPG